MHVGECIQICIVYLSSLYLNIFKIASDMSLSMAGINFVMMQHTLFHLYQSHQLGTNLACKPHKDRTGCQ